MSMKVNSIICKAGPLWCCILHAFFSSFCVMLNVLIERPRYFFV